MLKLTPAAAEYLAEARLNAGVPPSYGLRVASAAAPGEELRLTVEFAPTPSDDDDVSEEHGTKLFVARDVLEALGPTDAAISVARTERGSALVLIDSSGNGSA